ncbi:MAG: ABC transporter permease [Acidobacteria bacterium]|nr:ABC transporter permease [Acidobacteriota bacterium]
MVVVKQGSRATAIFLGAIGLVLTLLVAPNISGDTKAFGFEAPPTSAQISFNPQVLVGAIGILLIITAALSVSPIAGHAIVRWLTWISVASFLPLSVAIALALSESSSTNVTNLIGQSLILSTPIALGAMTGLWCERAGIINIGIEGMMLAAAGVGFMVYAVLGDANGTGWLWLSILIAVLAGGLTAAIHAALCIKYQIDQIVSGVVINLFALGLTGFLRSEVIVETGITSGSPTTDIALPLLSDIPVVGEELFVGGPIYWSMYVIVFLSWFVMYHTPWGLRVRSSGENPHAAETLGVNVLRIRYQAVILGGFIAGLAGAWFSMEQQAGFDDRLTNNAGFIALAALIFGKWKPWGAFAGALLFGFARAFQSRLQLLSVKIGDFDLPSEFLQSLPFIITIVVVAGALGRAVPPAAEGKPYRPGS